jgi:hypothetical protein
VEVDESSSKPYFRFNVCAMWLTHFQGEIPLSIRAMFDSGFDWLADNTKSFYMLPDSVELALYVVLAIYFAIKLTHQA